MRVDKSFWQGKRVFLTGHTGFKGSWLSLWLGALGAEVTGYALAPPTEPNLFALARVGERLRSVTGDVRDLEALTAALVEARPEVVFHLAAQPLVRESYQDPITTFSTNIMGSAHLLEAVRRAGGVRSVVMITSDKCYRNREWVWGYRENEMMGGLDPYSSSKGAAELVIQAMRHSFFGKGAAVASARAGNVIGGGDWSADRLVPDVLKALSENRQVLLRNPIATRPWQHVLEPLHGYLRLAEALHREGHSFAEAWNFGPEDRSAVSVAQVVELLHRIWGSSLTWGEDEGFNPHEDTFLKLDASKAATRLGWHPILSLEETLTWIVAWHKAYLSGDNMRRVTEEQISAFMVQAGQEAPLTLLTAS
jgi:CDP-glucose 4,6-dehydratase